MHSFIFYFIYESSICLIHPLFFSAWHSAGYILSVEWMSEWMSWIPVSLSPAEVSPHVVDFGFSTLFLTEEESRWWSSILVYSCGLPFCGIFMSWMHQNRSKPQLCSAEQKSKPPLPHQAGFIFPSYFSFFFSFLFNHNLSLVNSGKIWQGNSGQWHTDLTWKW